MRDQRNAESLARGHWKVFTVRECTVERDTEQLLEQLEALRSEPQGKADE